MSTPCLAQRRHTIALPETQPPVLRGHLELGGTNPAGEIIEVNNQYIERAGRPFFPVVGEFHYARCPADEWAAEVQAMKAGGINVVATYVFWNLHEREEGRFDWSGNLDLRRFIEVCARNEILALVRLGPFCHGEMRNGGLPDWLYGRAFEVRSNDPEYLAHVDRLYAAIGAQIRGHLYKDGGPVIGVQLENEYQHSAAPWEITYAGAAREVTVAERDVAVTHAGVSVSEVENRFAEEGRRHMATLKEIARRHGMDVPLYTATGWGNAAIVPRGCIPVTAGYPYPFWAPAAPSPFYLYKDIRRQPDYMPVSFDPELYPSLPAELGPGIMPTYSRRPRVPPASVAPLIVRTIGSGSNGIGYYMYHGGSTPVFGHFYSEESGGLPKINYDFQAPIGEYGQLRPHYHSLKLLHLFLESFSDRLAPMQTVLPASASAMTPADTDTLRFAVRSAGGSGFVFMHNFQDHVATKDLGELRVEVESHDGTVAFPHAGTFTLRAGATAILPFRLDLSGALLQSATVQPLTTLQRDGRTHHVFVAIEGLPPELVFAGAHAVTTSDCTAVVAAGLTIVRGPADAVFTFRMGERECLVVPHALALTAWKVGDSLWFADAAIATAGSEVSLVSRSRETVDVQVYPSVPPPTQLSGATIAPARAMHPGMSAFSVVFAPRKPAISTRRIGARKVAVSVGGGLDGLHDVIMEVNYVGDRGMAFIDGVLVADHFYYGDAWEVGLRRFIPRLAGREMILVFHPVQKDQAFLQDLDDSARPAFTAGEKEHLALGEIGFSPVYRAVLRSDYSGFTRAVAAPTRPRSIEPLDPIATRAATAVSKRL